MSNNLIKKIRKQLRPVRAVWEFMKGHVTLIKLRHYLRSDYQQLDHILPGELIVSLTSYIPRFSTIEPTLQCLLSQSVKADRIILWIAEEEMKNVPDNVKKLTQRGLEIRPTQNTKQYKKIIPALEAFPEAFIVTADDNAYYNPDWLKVLVESWDGGYNQIVCHKAYRIHLDEKKCPVSYIDWEWNVKGPAEDVLLFPVGVGGVLYPPGSLSVPEVLNKENFLKFSPSSNDMWLYIMGRQAKSVCKTTAYNKLETVWPKTQKVALAIHNTGRDTGQLAYDRQFQNLIDKYGNI